MNKTMKLTRKDKVVILILAFILTGILTYEFFPFIWMVPLGGGL